MFFEFGIKDVIDIVLVALVLYYIYRLMRESRSVNAFNGVMVFVVVWLFVSQVLEMRLLGTILDKLVSVGVIAVIIIFQDDIRKFLFNIGGHQRVRALKRFLASSKQKDKDTKEVKQMIMPLVMASINMSRQKVGALIVIERSSSLDDIVATGDKIDANINQRLIENIFFKNSPLHDGAVVITDKRIKAALPTIQYLLGTQKEEVTIADTRIQNPYNTYRNAGLPPGPIGSPGMDAIKACLNPEITEYLYFVAEKDGHHRFTKTYGEHLKAIADIHKNDK